MQIEFLGGASEVGGSSIFLSIDGKNILFDAGIRQNASKDAIPNFRAVQEYGSVDAIIISHAHLDHIGCLPLISKEYPQARIYMNNMTKDLVRVLLYDSLKLMNNREGEIPLYAEADVQNTLDRIFTINYEVKFPIYENMFVTFYNAGHIAGASCVYLESSEGAVFYSGDFSAFSQRTVEGAKIPRLRPDVAIIESTYGDKLHSNREIEEEVLIDTVKECIEKKGKMIIPAFALGRAQEVILILKSAINRGKLKKVNIYVDGMVRDINRAYKNNPLYLRNSLGKKILQGKEPFYDNNIIEVKKTDNRDDIINKNEAAVIVSSSGMLTGGPSTYYAEKIASMENGYIVITGYQDEESPGRKILDLLESSDEEKRLVINNLNIPVNCTMQKVGLSAHGDKSEIKGLIQKLTPKNVFFVHGNEEVINNLGSEISKEYLGRVFTPKCGEKFNIQIKNPRKQWKKTFLYKLCSTEVINEENIKELWKFIDEKYEDKLFTIEELIFIWTGNTTFDEDIIKHFKNIILNSIYFESDNRRLFLFKRRIKSDIEEDLKPKELTQQELSKIIEEKFNMFQYKKISYITNNREIILNFDFPQSIDSTIYNIIDEFNKNNVWKVKVSDKVNINAAEVVIKKYIDSSVIKKISFYPEKMSIQVSLNDKVENLEEISKKLNEITGLKYIIENSGETEISSGSNIKTNSEDYYFQCTNDSKLEQNEALYYIDQAFYGEKFKPYKKSIKNNNRGKYIELAFITPDAGIQYTKKIQDLCEDIGWDLSISDKTNQNELISITNVLCAKNNIEIKKNPSYNPMERKVIINIINGEKNFPVMEKEFYEQTACIIGYKKL